MILIHSQTAEMVEAFNRFGVAQKGDENEPIYFEENIVKINYLGKMTERCQFCFSKFFPSERPDDGLFTICCQKGKLKLPPPIKYDAQLRDMMTNPNNPKYENFHKNIRAINASFSFVTFGANLKVPPGRGDYVFMVNGHPTHVMNTLIPEENKNARYAQIYVLDKSEGQDSGAQNDIRKQAHEANENIDPMILACVHDALHNAKNKYIDIFYTVGQKLKEAQENNEDLSKVSVVFNEEYKQPGVHPGRQNAPTNDEVAYVYVDDNGGEPPSFNRAFRVYAIADKDKNRKYDSSYLNITSPHLQPMTYPIFWLNGQSGWNVNWTCEPYPPKKKEANARRITLLQYYAAHIQIRDGEENWRPIIHGGRLFQQWITDAALMVESNDLDFIKFNQDKLKAFQYAALYRASPAGVPRIVPSTFQGSVRNMRENCLDALAIVRDFGGPDLFITFTANPKWKEVGETIEFGQKVADRPEAMDRVFYEKFKVFIELFTKKCFAGKTVAHIWVIEFQKRGLPHAHCLFSLREEDKFTAKERIDKYFSAEIPDPEKNPRLFELVTSMMVHGPCSTTLCIKNGRCSKNYPKPVCPETFIDEKGYTQYRRRPTGHFIGKRQRILNNGNVVPYMPILLKMFEAHINAEVVSKSMKTVKYLFKYIFKVSFDSFFLCNLFNENFLLRDTILQAALYT